MRKSGSSFSNDKLKFEIEWNILRALKRKKIKTNLYPVLAFPAHFPYKCALHVDSARYYFGLYSHEWKRLSIKIKRIHNIHLRGLRIMETDDIIV